MSAKNPWTTQVLQPAGTSISQVLRTLQRSHAQKDLRALICFLLVLLTVGSAVALMLTRMVLGNGTSRLPGQPSSSTVNLGTIVKSLNSQQSLADVVSRAPSAADTGDNVNAVATTTTMTKSPGVADVANTSAVNDATWQ